MSYSPPFRLYLLLDLETGERRQVIDKDKAQELARDIARRTGASLESILKPSKYWYSRRYLEGRKVQRVNTKQATKHGALRWVQDRNVMASTGAAEPRKQAFGEAVDLWLAEKRLARLAEKTLSDYASVVGFWKVELGTLLVSSVNADDILRYFSRRESGELTEGRKPGPRVLVKDRVLLGSFFGWARRRGLATVNPVEDAPRWKLEEKEPRALTREEATKLLAACREPYKVTVTRKGFRDYAKDQVFLPPPHLYGIVLTALHSLLRLGNVLTLGWGEVDLERGVIRLAPGRMKTRRELELELTPTLKAYLASLPRGAPAAPVFVDSLTGKPLAPQGIKKSFRSAAKRAGLGGLKFHTLRKTGATILLDAGIPLQVVQRMGGWKKPDVLLRHYAAVTAEQRQRAVGVLDRLGG